MKPNSKPENGAAGPTPDGNTTGATSSPHSSTDMTPEAKRLNESSGADLGESKANLAPSGQGNLAQSLGQGKPSDPGVAGEAINAIYGATPAAHTNPPRQTSRFVGLRINNPADAEAIRRALRRQDVPALTIDSRELLVGGSLLGAVTDLFAKEGNEAWESTRILPTNWREVRDQTAQKMARTICIIVEVEHLHKPTAFGGRPAYTHIPGSNRDFLWGGKVIIGGRLIDTRHVVWLFTSRRKDVGDMVDKLVAGLGLESVRFTEPPSEDDVGYKWVASPLAVGACRDHVLPSVACLPAKVGRCLAAVFRRGRRKHR